MDTQQKTLANGNNDLPSVNSVQVATDTEILPALINSTLIALQRVVTDSKSTKKQILVASLELRKWIGQN